MEANTESGKAPATQTTEPSSVNDPNAQEDSQPEKQPEVKQPLSASASCDGCGKSIEDVRMKCQQCPDFDYCSDCFVHSKRVHPYHDFKAFYGHDLASEDEQEEYQALALVEATKEESLVNQPGDSLSTGSDCKACLDLSDRLSIFQAALKDEKFKSMYDQGAARLSIAYVAKISKVVEGAVGGCAFCIFFLHSFFGYSSIWTWGIMPETPWYLELEKDDNQDKLRKLIETVMGVLTTLPHDRLYFRLDKKFTKQSSIQPNRISIGVHTNQDEGVTLKGMIHRTGTAEIELDMYETAGPGESIANIRRPPNPEPGSEAGLAWARSCLKTCLEHHGDTCAPDHSTSMPVLPTRVIDVSSENQIYLRETADAKHGRYAALSYVWGKKKNFVTLKSTYQQMKSGFSVEDLPQTLKDAVTVVRSLGLQYLWVDAICIIQDDLEDKAREISGILSTYRNADVTIVAASAASVGNGFLGGHASSKNGLWKGLISLPKIEPNPAATSMKEVLDMPKTRSSGSWWLTEEFSGGIGEGSRDPVSERAWCLQERLLSSRILTYGRWPTWRCNKMAASDGGFYIQGDEVDQKHQQLSNLVRRAMDKETAREDVFTANALMSIWRTTVRDYTRRNITDPHDIFPAIGGIAEYIGQVVGGQHYAAGLWENNLLYDLMWTANGEEWLARPDEWRAPTWSWAGVDGPVSHADIDPQSVPLAAAKIIDRNTSLHETDRISPSDMTLQLTGPLTELTRGEVLELFDAQHMSPPPPKNNSAKDWNIQMMEGIASQLKSKCKLEFPDGVDNANSRELLRQTLPERVFAMVMFSQDYRRVNEDRVDVLCYSGLIMTQTEGGKYERIGYFAQEVRSWLEMEDERWKDTSIIVQ